MFKNIATKKTYKTKTGEEKTIWQTVGTLKEFNGKQYIELNIFPNVDFYVFENKEKGDGSTSAKNAPTQNEPVDYQAMVNEVVSDGSISDDINPDDIPF